MPLSRTILPHNCISALANVEKRDGGGKVDTHLRQRAVDQQDGAQNHRDGAARGENTVRHELGFEDEKREGQQQQRGTQPVDGQHRKGRQAKQRQDRSRHARKNQART